MEGFIAVTDFGWYEHLSKTPGPKDANFWRPSTRQSSLATGTPFFFKLKHPHNAIAGFGYVAGFSILPDWLAWDTFGEANGVSEFAVLQARLAKIQARAKIDVDPQGRIGCLLIAESRFFDQADWIPQPRDWGARTVVGANYDLEVGEGLRIFTECLQHIGSVPVVPRVAAASLVREPEVRYGPPMLHTPRLGQSIFRVKVLDAYKRACAVTEEHSLPVLEAAHIKPFAEGGENAISNGLLLRSDLHRLFDRGYVTVENDGRFIVGRRLKDDFENGRSYYGLHGKHLSIPPTRELQPSPESLAWHRDNLFLG